VLVKYNVLAMGTYPGGRVAVVTKFCKVASDICGSLVWNFLHVTRPAYRILRWLLDFWKIYAPLVLDITRMYSYRGADMSLARPGRKQATGTEYFEFHISYL
jgi:hypothetical protein